MAFSMKEPKKTTYVSFQKNGARIYVNQPPPFGFPYVVDPDFTAVKDLPPNLWALRSGKIVPMKQGKKYKYCDPAKVLFWKGLLMGLSLGVAGTNILLRIL